jgi:hypothetical protein
MSDEDRYYASARGSLESLLFGGFDHPKASPYAVRGYFALPATIRQFMWDEYEMVLDCREPLLTLH